MAELAKVSKRTIDYYTQLGLLTAERSKSNYRYYSEDALERLKLIELFKREKLSLEEIRERLNTLDATPASSREVTEKVHDLHERMRQLEEEVLKLKPLLSKLNEQQLKVLTKQLSVQGASLYHALNLLLGESLFL